MIQRFIGKTILVLTVCLTYGFPTFVSAETFRERHTDGMFLELEQYLWEESDSNGDFLRSDEGQRFSGGYVSDNLGWNHPGIVYEFSGKGTLGIVYYRDSSPKGYLGLDTETLVSKADYFGLNLIGSAGQRYGYLAEPYMLEVLAGIEVDIWGRNIRTAGLESGIGRGLKEMFLVVSPTLSAGVSGWWWGHRNRVILGIKYPTAIEQLNIDIAGSLQPQGLPSPYGHLELTRILDVFNYWINLRLYFDSRFIEPAGPRVNYASDAVMQFSGGVRLTFDPH